MDLPGESNKAKRHHWIYAGNHFVISYVISFRGPVGMLLDLEGMHKHFNSQVGDEGSPERHMVIVLLGQIKGKHNERQHLVPSLNETKSGIRVCQWLRRTLAASFSEGQVTSRALCDKKGFMLTTRVMNGMFHKILEEMRVEQHKTLFLGCILSRANIEETNDVYCSFCQGSNSRAIAMEVSPIDIDVINRGTKKEAASGTTHVSHKIKQQYADMAILLPAFER